MDLTRVHENEAPGTCLHLASIAPRRVGSGEDDAESILIVRVRWEGAARRRGHRVETGERRWMELNLGGGHS
jgi:hypothetical protein